MFLHNRKRDELTINLTPLIDVVFLLLIFFMVTTSFARHSELTLNLPEADAATRAEQTKVIEVAINAEGHFVVNGKRLVNDDRATLKRAIEKMRGDRDLPVVIAGDRAVHWQAIITALDVMAELGIAQVSLAARTPS